MFGLELSFRSFTLSPFASVLAQARRQARRHLEVGGIVPENGCALMRRITAFPAVAPNARPLGLAFAAQVSSKPQAGE